MGLQFKELVVKEEVTIKSLSNRILAVDGMNLLYQFLTTIRSVDGSVLTTRNGRVTSHLIGLFSRTTALMEEGLKLVFVFDGKPPELKQKTWQKRSEIKKEAAEQFKLAEDAGNLDEMKKYASRTAVLTKDMLSDAKELITALGLPIVQAPSEGEAQTAYMVKNGTAYASISQDYDNLIFGCPLLIRNLSIAGKKKKAGKLAYETIKPEAIYLKKVLEELKLDLDQLIVLAILVGTDYNPGGVKGIGPKTALKLLQHHHHNFEIIFQEVEWEKSYPDLGWQVLIDTFKNIPVTDDYKLEWKAVDEKKLYSLLVDQMEFSPERVNSKIEILRKQKTQQKGLGSYF